MSMRAQPCRRGCGVYVVLARKGEDTQKWAVLVAEPVEPSRVADANTIRVVDGPIAYKLAHMRESLEFRTVLQPDIGPAEDYPWHPIHHCKEN
jgi:hypothetical protein